MVQAIISINDDTNRVLNMVKAKYSLKDKSQAIEMMAKEYREELLEPEIRPEYLRKLRRIEKEKTIPFNSIAELIAHLENAQSRNKARNRKKP